MKIVLFQTKRIIEILVGTVPTRVNMKPLIVFGETFKDTQIEFSSCTCILLEFHIFAGHFPCVLNFLCVY